MDKVEYGSYTSKERVIIGNTIVITSIRAETETITPDDDAELQAIWAVMQEEEALLAEQKALEDKVYAAQAEVSAVKMQAIRARAKLSGILYPHTPTADNPNPDPRPESSPAQADF